MEEPFKLTEYMPYVIIGLSGIGTTAFLVSIYYHFEALASWAKEQIKENPLETKINLSSKQDSTL